MTRDEAHQRPANLNADPDVERHWLAREAEGAWDVVRVSAPGLSRVTPTGAHAESQTKPETPDDPQSTLERHFPPYGVP